MVSYSQDPPTVWVKAGSPQAWGHGTLFYWSLSLGQSAWSLRLQGVPWHMGYTEVRQTPASFCHEEGDCLHVLLPTCGNVVMRITEKCLYYFFLLLMYSNQWPKILTLMKVLYTVIQVDVSRGGRMLEIPIYLVSRRAWQPTPLFLPGESHGESDMTV